MSIGVGPRIVVLAIALAISSADDPSFAESEFEGKTCDDHDPCTIDDRFVAGMCSGEPRRCDDGRRCTDDFCDRSSGRCRAGLRIDQCFIDGACRADGDANPDNACQVCNPTSSGTTWSGATTCDDGDPCTTEDRCVDGGCVGRPYTCPSPGGCRAARCDGRGGCSEEAMPDRCTIEGTCYATGATHPYDPCLQCDPDRSGKAWVPAEGATCPGGVCQGGRCVATLLIEKLGEGEGRIIGPGFTCRSDCLQTLAPGQRVELTVVTEAGSVFRGWSGACVGIAPCVLDANAELRAIAIFDRGDAVDRGAMATLRVRLEGSGSVRETGGRIGCGDRCATELIDGTAVDLSAIPAPGHRFGGWAGGCVGREPTCSVLVTGFTEVVARFVPVQ